MKIKKWEVALAAFVVIIFVLQFAVVSISNEQKQISSKLIRMHVIANSNSAEDQNLKLAVRDSVNDYIYSNMKNINNINSAEAFIINNKNDIINNAQQAVIDNGYNYSVDVVLTEEYYPTRKYDNFSLPAGEYTSLQIKIGNAEGENWWCVVFPPLCNSSCEVTDYVSLTDDEIEFITADNSGVILKFKLLEIINEFKRLYY